MTTLTKMTCIAAFGALLSGCGGSSEQNFIDHVDEFEALSGRVNNMAESGARVVDNTKGSASFAGKAEILAGRSQSDLTVLIGDADVNVNFDGRTSISGEINNFTGAAGVSAYIDSYGGVQVFDPGTLDDYSGSVRLSNGTVGSGNQLTVDYAGTLRGNGDRVVVSGTMDGGFLGNPSVRALIMADEGSGTVNGSSVSTVVVVVAERD